MDPFTKINRRCLYEEMDKTFAVKDNTMRKMAMQATIETQFPPLVNYLQPDVIASFILRYDLASVNLQHTCAQDSGFHVLSRDALLRIDQLTDDDLEKMCTQISRQANRVSQLSLKNQMNISAYGLAWVAQLPNMTSLDIQGCNKAVNESDKHIDVLRFFKKLNLVSLKLGGGNFSDERLVHLKSLRLTTLEIDSLKITGIGLSHLPTTLTSLNLSNSSLTNSSLKLLQCVHLTSLTLNNCPSLTDEGLEAIEKFDKLTFLNLTDCQFTGEGFTSLKKLKQLTDLDLSYCENLTNIGLSHIGNLPLQKLSLNESDDVTDEGFAYLKRSPTYLWISGCNNLKNGLAKLPFERLTTLILNCSTKLTDESLIDLKSAKQITELDLSYCCRLSDKALEGIRKLFRLIKLDISGLEKISDAGLVNLEMLSRLNHLYLSNCPKITDKGLDSIKELTELTDLDLSKCKMITDIGLINLKGLSNLNELYLQKCRRITASGLVHIKELPLKRLSLRDCTSITQLETIKNFTHLKFLGLAGGTFKEEELLHLAGLPIADLNLSQYYPLTNVGLSYLKNLPYLTNLDIGFCTNISNEGAEHLKDLPLETLVRTEPCYIDNEGKKILVKRPQYIPTNHQSVTAD